MSYNYCTFKIIFIYHQDSIGPTPNMTCAENHLQGSRGSVNLDREVIAMQTQHSERGLLCGVCSFLCVWT